MIIYKSSFHIPSYCAPKYLPTGESAHDSDNDVKKHFLDLRDGSIVDGSYTNLKKREFTFGAEFVSSEDGEKFALVDKDNSLITEFCFEGYDNFREGLAAVCVKGRWGYIEPNGDFAIAPQFKNASGFENSLAGVQDAKTGKYGYINKRGEVVIGYYDYLTTFSDGLAYAKNKKSRSFKFYDEKGALALVMKKPLKAVSEDDIRALLDFAHLEFEGSRSHNQLNDMGFKLINDDFYVRKNLEFCEFHDGLCQFIERTADGPKIGFYDKSGNIAIPAQFDFVSRFNMCRVIYHLISRWTTASRSFSSTSKEILWN